VARSSRRDSGSAADATPWGPRPLTFRSSLLRILLGYLALSAVIWGAANRKTFAGFAVGLAGCSIPLLSPLIMRSPVRRVATMLVRANRSPLRRLAIGTALTAVVASVLSLVSNSAVLVGDRQVRSSLGPIDVVVEAQTNKDRMRAFDALSEETTGSVQQRLIDGGPLPVDIVRARTVNPVDPASEALTVDVVAVTVERAVGFGAIPSETGLPDRKLGRGEALATANSPWPLGSTASIDVGSIRFPVTIVGRTSGIGIAALPMSLATQEAKASDNVAVLVVDPSTVADIGEQARRKLLVLSATGDAVNSSLLSDDLAALVTRTIEERSVAGPEVTVPAETISAPPEPVSEVSAEVEFDPLVVDQVVGVVGDDAGEPDPLVVTEPPDTEPADTEPADTEPADTEPADTEPADTATTAPSIVAPETSTPLDVTVVDLKTPATAWAQQERDRALRSTAGLALFFAPLLAVALASLLLRAVTDDARITAALRLSGMSARKVAAARGGGPWLAVLVGVVVGAALARVGQALVGSGPERWRLELLTVPLLVCSTAIAIIGLLTIRRTAVTSVLSVRHPDQNRLWALAMWLPVLVALLGVGLLVVGVVGRAPVIAIGVAVVIVIAMVIERRLSVGRWSPDQVIARTSRGWRRDTRTIAIVVLVATGFAAGGLGAQLSGLDGITSRQRTIALICVVTAIVALSWLGAQTMTANGNQHAVLASRVLAAGLGSLPVLPQGKTPGDVALSKERVARLSYVSVSLAAGAFLAGLVYIGERLRQSEPVSTQAMIVGLVCALICVVVVEILMARGRSLRFGGTRKAA
jgi:hypothetical protein